MLVITGWNSRIAEELRKLLNEDGYLKRQMIRVTYDDMPLDAERYFFCAGLLLPKKMEEMTNQEYILSMGVNFTYPMGACEDILAANPRARICVMGSESGYSGSYNTMYASAKRALHEYVEAKKLQPEQQLVAVSPGIISDAGMTLRRADTDHLAEREKAHPKKRFANSLEVAKLVRFLLYDDEGYITNTVIRMHGGDHLK